MALKTNIQINVNGNYVKGHIVDGSFVSYNDGITKVNNSKQYSESFIKSAIKELEELSDLMNGMNVADILAPDEEKLSASNAIVFFDEDNWDNL